MNERLRKNKCYRCTRIASLILYAHNLDWSSTTVLVCNECYLRLKSNPFMSIHKVVEMPPTTLLIGDEMPFFIDKTTYSRVNSWIQEFEKWTDQKCVSSPTLNFDNSWGNFFIDFSDCGLLDHMGNPLTRLKSITIDSLYVRLFDEAMLLWGTKA